MYVYVLMCKYISILIWLGSCWGNYTLYAMLLCQNCRWVKNASDEFLQCILFTIAVGGEAITEHLRDPSLLPGWVTPATWYTTNVLQGGGGLPCLDGYLMSPGLSPPWWYIFGGRISGKNVPPWGEHSWDTKYPARRGASPLYNISNVPRGRGPPAKLHRFLI